MSGLDFSDLRLLYELDRNSRQSFNSLARKLRMNKDTVKYRIQKFMDLGFIKSFNAIINSSKLGFFSFRVTIKFFQVSPEKEKEIINFFLSNKNLIWLVEVEGSWDINSCFLYRDVHEMNSFWSLLMSKYGGFILNKQLAIFTNINYFGRAFLINKTSNDFSMRVFSLPEPKQIDDASMKIISLLSKNARMPIIEIAKEISLTPKTIISKIKHLEKEKIILGYRTELDMGKLGYNYYKVLMNALNMTPEKYKRTKAFLFEHPSVVYHDEALGGYDVEFELQVKNDAELRAFMNAFKEKFAEVIRDYEVLQYYKEHKLRFFPEE